MLSFCLSDKKMSKGYNAHIMIIPTSKSSNQSFAIGLVSNIDTALQPLEHASMLWLFGCAVILLGISFLLILLLHYRHRDEQIIRELELLRQKNISMEELNRKTQEMAHHQRLEMIGTLTSGIAHEFNNLLTPIMGYSMMMLAGKCLLLSMAVSVAASMDSAWKISSNRLDTLIKGEEM